MQVCHICLCQNVSFLKYVFKHISLNKRYLKRCKLSKFSSDKEIFSKKMFSSLAEISCKFSKYKIFEIVIG